MSRTITLIAVASCAINLACADDSHDEDGHTHESATATLEPKKDNTTLAGTATFSGEPGKISVKVDLTGAPPGDHGLHIHENGDCSAPDAMSAGGHWNPDMHMHGAPGATSHLGDLGNITVNADGTATLTATNALWEIGTGTARDVKGKAVIVHAKADDLTTQPTGDAGDRIGCGVIK
jgi:Cu-Zn family superoxide dismutase